MNQLSRIAVAGLAVVSVAGCAGLQYGKAEKMTPQGSAFATSLSADYLALSKAEYSEGDYRDSDTFAVRSMAAGNNNPPAPEETSARDLPSDKVGELSAARNRLVTALDASARTKIPDEAARAQAMYECWMQEQEENWPFQQDHIAACRDGFKDAMARIEAAMAGVPAAPGSYLVFFDWDKANLTSEAMEILKTVTDTIKSGAYKTVMATGHTDTSGPADYNMGLSERRAKNVRAALAKMGIEQDKIETAAKGETEPLVKTGDGVREPQNRRVEIAIER